VTLPHLAARPGLRLVIMMQRPAFGQGFPGMGRGPDDVVHHRIGMAGWPLGDPARHADAVMENIIGAEADAWESLAKSGALHLYGKAQARPGRKMGHVTRLKPRDR